MQKVVLITGCSSGFGFGMALKFSRAGYQVFAGVRSPKSPGSLNLIETARKEKLPLQLVTIDVTKDETIQKAVKETIKKTNRIDVLINNAGFGYLGPIENFSIEEVQSQYDTNI